jgi:hypothetical protein
MARQRRWWWWAGAALAILVVAWWSLGDALVVAVANRFLPRTIEGLELTAAATNSPPTSVALDLALTPARARALAAVPGGCWIPPTVLRRGSAVDGAWHGLVAGPPLAVRARLSADEPPIARVLLPARMVNDLIAAHHRQQQAGSAITWDYRIDPGSKVVDDGPPSAIEGGWRRRFRATASGEVEAGLAGDRCLVRLARVEATIDLDLLRAGDGWALRGDVAVGACESTIVECRSMALRLAASALPHLLESLVDQALSEESLEGAHLPGWFPHDLRLDGRLD